MALAPRSHAIIGDIACSLASALVDAKAFDTGGGRFGLLSRGDPLLGSLGRFLPTGRQKYGRGRNRQLGYASRIVHLSFSVYLMRWGGS